MNWYVGLVRVGDPQSERQILYDIIRENPSISTQDIVKRWPFVSDVSLLLNEMHRAGFLVTERTYDLPNWKDPAP